MARRKKSALNQSSEPLEENKIGWVNPEPEQDVKKIIEELEENHGVDGQQEIDEMINTELPTLEEIEEEQVVEEEIKNPSEVSEDIPDKFPVEVEDVEEKSEVTKEDLMRLSKKDFRYYQRTGTIPKR